MAEDSCMLEVCFRFLSVYSGNSATACSPFLAVGFRKPVQPLYLWTQYPCWVLPVGDGLLALLPVKAQRPAVRSFFFIPSAAAISSLALPHAFISMICFVYFLDMAKPLM